MLESYADAVTETKQEAVATAMFFVWSGHEYDMSSLLTQQGMCEKLIQIRQTKRC